LPGSLVNSACHPSRLGKSSTSLLAGVKTGHVTCVGWQVKLCDPIWQAMPHSSVMGLVSFRAIHYFNLLTFSIYTVSQKNCANLFFTRTLSNFDRL